jgi:hypothetical protein
MQACRCAEQRCWREVLLIVKYPIGLQNPALLGHGLGNDATKCLNRLPRIHGRKSDIAEHKQIGHDRCRTFELLALSPERDG